MSITPSFNTLAQLRNFAQNKPKKGLFKRARSKHITRQIMVRLASLQSPLQQQYWNAYHCSDKLIQAGDEVTSRYCGTRGCNICNRIRTAKMMNGYSEQLKDLSDLNFVTLTIPNVKLCDLSYALNTMTSNAHKIQDLLRKKFRDVYGIRKLEITYNSAMDSYHPHFHIIVNGRDKANLILSRWLKLNPMANVKAQDIRAADKNSLNELFKYTTKIEMKIGSSKVIYVNALDAIFQNLRGRRTVQPFGMIRKICDEIETIDDLKAQAQDLPYYDFMVWEYDVSDWVNGEGEVATGYFPIENEFDFNFKKTM